MFMCVRCTFRSSDFFTIRQKRIRGGVRSLKVTARDSNNAGSSYEYPHCLSAMHRLALDNGPTQFNSPNTHTRCALSCTAAGREGGRQGRSDKEGRGGEGKARKGGKLQGRYPEDGTGQYIHKPCHSAAIALETLVHEK